MKIIIQWRVDGFSRSILNKNVHVKPILARYLSNLFLGKIYPSQMFVKTSTTWKITRKNMFVKAILSKNVFVRSIHCINVFVKNIPSKNMFVKTIPANVFDKSIPCKNVFVSVYLGFFFFKYKISWQENVCLKPSHVTMVIQIISGMNIVINNSTSSVCVTRECQWEHPHQHVKTVGGLPDTSTLWLSIQANHMYCNHREWNKYILPSISLHYCSCSYLIFFYTLCMCVYVQNIFMPQSRNVYQSVYISVCNGQWMQHFFS